MEDREMNRMFYAHQRWFGGWWMVSSGAGFSTRVHAKGLKKDIAFYLADILNGNRLFGCEVSESQKGCVDITCVGVIKGKTTYTFCTRVPIERACQIILEWIEKQPKIGVTYMGRGKYMVRKAYEGAVIFDNIEDAMSYINKGDRMKTLEEKISVMQAFARGEKIEYIKLRKVLSRLAGSEPCSCDEQIIETWMPFTTPIWDWLHYDYRIAAPEPKSVDKAIESAIKQHEDKFHNVDPFADAKKWFKERTLEYKHNSTGGWSTWWNGYLEEEPLWSNWKPSDFRRRPDADYTEETAHFYNMDLEHAHGIASFVRRNSDIKAHLGCGGVLTLIKRTPR